MSTFLNTDSLGAYMQITSTSSWSSCVKYMWNSAVKLLDVYLKQHCWEGPAVNVTSSHFPSLTFKDLPVNLKPRRLPKQELNHLYPQTQWLTPRTPGSWAGHKQPVARLALPGRGLRGSAGNWVSPEGSIRSLVTSSVRCSLVYKLPVLEQSQASGVCEFPTSWWRRFLSRSHGHSQRWVGLPTVSVQSEALFIAQTLTPAAGEQSAFTQRRLLH